MLHSGYTQNMATSRLWTLSSIPEKKSTGKSKKKEIIYPIFDEYAKLSVNPYWQEIFTNCSHKKFPRGFSYKEGTIIFRKNNKVNQLQLSTNINESLIQVMDWFHRHGNYGIITEEKKTVLDEKTAKIVLPSMWEWKDIRIKKVKLYYISEYIYELATELKLTADETKDLEKYIHAGLVIGYLTNNDINFKEGKIQSIDGINIKKMDNNVATMHYNHKMTSRRVTRRESKTSVSIFRMAWEEYLGNLMGRVNNRNTIRSVINSGDTTRRSVDSIPED